MVESPTHLDRLASRPLIWEARLLHLRAETTARI